MAKDAPGMRGYRSRNKDGELRNCKVKDKDLTPCNPSVSGGSMWIEETG